MSNELERLNRIRVTCNYVLSALGLIAGLSGYFVSLSLKDDADQFEAITIGLGWMCYICVLSVLGNYVAGIVESSIVHLEQVRAKVDKEVGINEAEASEENRPVQTRQASA